MRQKRLLQALAIAAALLFVGAAGAMAENPVVYDNWQSGNAATECAQIGEYNCSLKIDEWDQDTEGIMDGVYEATCAGPNGEDWSTNITISNSTAYLFDWSSSPSAIGAVIVKAGKGANVWLYNPQVWSDSGLYGYGEKEIGHVTFCYDFEPEETVYLGQWCSPGYWRQPQHAGSWIATEIGPEELYSDQFGSSPPLSKKGMADGANPDPTLLEVLQFPQYYGGEAFNNVGDLLSGAHPDVDFQGNRVEGTCPLN